MESKQASFLDYETVFHRTSSVKFSRWNPSVWLPKTYGSLAIMKGPTWCWVPLIPTLTWEVEASRSLNLRSAWSRVSGQPGLRRETSSWKTKNRKRKERAYSSCWEVRGKPMTSWWSDEKWRCGSGGSRCRDYSLRAVSGILSYLCLGTTGLNLKPAA